MSDRSTRPRTHKVPKRYRDGAPPPRNITEEEGPVTKAIAVGVGVATVAIFGLLAMGLLVIVEAIAWWNGVIS